MRSSSTVARMPDKVCAALDHIADIAAKIIAMSTMKDAVQELADKAS
jgi:N-methylhydantoinase B/oxoprolinase/acetone carboxylase alpha subunit